MGTPYRNNDRMVTPYRSTESISTPYRSIGTPLRPSSERIGTPLRPSSERIGTPLRSLDRVATPHRSLDRAGTPHRSLDIVASPFRSEKIASPFCPSERGATTFRSSETIASPFLSSERGTTFRSSEKIASPYCSSEWGTTFRPNEKTAYPYCSSERGTTPLNCNEKITYPHPSSDRGSTPLRSTEMIAYPNCSSERGTTPLCSSEKIAPPYCSSEKIVNGETWRSSESGVDGRCNRNSSESKPFVTQKDMEGHPLENGGSPDGSGKPLNVVVQRSVDDMPTDNSVPRSDLDNTKDQLHSKDQHDKIDSSSALGTGQRLERGRSLGSIDLKPHRWTRLGSLSARSSGFTHLSGSKSFGAESSEAKVEVHDKIVNPVESQSGDVAGCAQSAALSEEASSRKKPRVRWGEGLAKYEKKKVDVPDDCATKDRVVDCSSIEASCSDLPNLADKSPRLASFSGFASPTTPSSVGYSSSPGIGEKRFLDTSTTDNVSSRSSGSPDLPLRDIVGAKDFDLESLDATSLANLSSSLSELLQFNDPTSEDSSFVRATAMNKLRVWKGSLTKALEITESEIDSLENELKSLVPDSGTSGPCPAASSSLPVSSEVKTSEDQVVGSDAISHLAGLQFGSSANQIVEDQELDMEEVPDPLRGEGADSPGTVTSKLLEPLASSKDDVVFDRVKYNEHSADLDAITSTTLEPEAPICNSESPVDKILHGDGGVKLCDLIIASNKECAARAADLFKKLLPSDQCGVPMSRTSSVSNCLNDTLIKEKFVARKQFLKFKERVYTYKFMALRRLWREDMRLLSVRKNRAKSQKRSELSFQTLRGSNQKHRSSVRSRFSPDGNLNVAPSVDVLNFTSKLLSGSQFKLQRPELRMPAMVIDKKEKMAMQFVSKNGLVQDPCAVEKERALINPWTTEEKEIFMDKLNAYGKDFGKIASFLDHKKTADCVQFYYKNHKSESFRKMKKKPKLAGKGESCPTHNYLVTSEKRWNREANAASLDMLGAVVAANPSDSTRNLKNCESSVLLGAASNSIAPQLADDSARRLDNFDALDSDRETVAVGVLAGICGSLSSEAMSSCITSSFDPAESHQDSKSQKVASSMRRLLTPEVGQSIDDGSCSDDIPDDEACGVDWTDEEKSAFVQAVTTYGKDYDMVSKCVRTKSKEQCKLFFSKSRILFSVIGPRSGNDKVPVSDGADCGGSDSEGACHLQNGSGICSEKSETKLDDGPVFAQKMDVEMNNCSEGDEDAISQSNAEELMESVPEADEDMVDVNLETCESNLANTQNLLPELNRSEEDSRTGEIELENPELEQEHLIADVSMGDCEMELNSVGICKTGSAGSRSLLEPSLSSEEDGDAGPGFAVEEPVACEMSIDQNLCVSGAEGETIANVERKQLPSENRSGNEDAGIDANVCVSQQVDCPDQDMNTSGNASDAAVDASTLVEYPEKEQHPSSGSLSNSLVHDVSLAKGNCTTDAPPPSSLTKILEQGVHSATGVGTSSFEKQPIISTDADDRLPAESCRVPEAQLIPAAATRKEINGNVCSNKPAALQTLSAVDGNARSGLNLLQGCFLQKCNSLGAQSSGAELPFLSLDKRSNPSNTPDSGKRCKTGDVKLFGKILTRTSTEQNDSTGGTRENNLNGNQLDGSSSGLSMRSRARSADANSVPPEGERSGLENASFRSYGFWDGNRVQTGITSLPDSSLLLAKYPAAFSNFSASFPSGQQQPLPSVVQSNGQFFSGSAVAGNPMYMNWENAGNNRVHPFNLNVMQRQEVVVPEAQRSNGMEGFQQAESAAAAAVRVNNVAGRRGIFSGEVLTGVVSDPVAAIKLHYAKAQVEAYEARRAGEARRT